MKNDLS